MLLTGPFAMLSMPSFDFHLPPCTEGFLIHLSPLWQLPLWQLPLFPSVAQFPCVYLHIILVPPPGLSLFTQVLRVDNRSNFKILSKHFKNYILIAIFGLSKQNGLIEYKHAKYWTSGSWDEFFENIFKFQFFLYQNCKKAHNEIKHIKIQKKTNQFLNIACFLVIPGQNNYTFLKIITLLSCSINSLRK